MTKKRDIKLKTLMIIVSIIFTMVFAASCGGYDSLEEYVNSSDEVKSQVENLTDLEDSMVVTIKDNTVTYTVTYDKSFDDEIKDVAADTIKKNVEIYESTFQSIAKALEVESGVDGITVRVLYRDIAGNDLYDNTFTAIDE